MTTTPNKLRIDIVSDVVCPWCIIGHLQLERTLAETAIPYELHWQPFELNPENYQQILQQLARDPL